MTVTGVLFADTNHFHPLLDGKAYAATGAPLVAIKIGQRSKDPEADASVARAEAQGLMVIGYLFGVHEDGATQADRLVSWFPWKPGRMWCIDVEFNSPEPADSITDAQARDCVNRLKVRHPKGLAPWSYSGASRTVAGAHHWVAAYSDIQPAGADAWQFYGGVTGPEPHHLPGVGGSVCDMNKLIVSVDKLRSWAGLVDEPGLLLLRRGS